MDMLISTGIPAVIIIITANIMFYRMKKQNKYLRISMPIVFILVVIIMMLSFIQNAHIIYTFIFTLVGGIISFMLWLKAIK